MEYPLVRPRRLRLNPALRELLAEIILRPTDLVYPLFILSGQNRREPIASMPGIYQQTVENALIEIDRALKLGIKAIMLFGVPDEKDTEATSAFNEHGVIQHAVRVIKAQFGDDLVVMTDTCLCEYTNHGHCGVVVGHTILNDPSLDILAKTAVSQAEAGADMICPSDMMDGRIQHIRLALDEAGFSDTAIMAYAVKYASSFYGPFRDAAQSTPSFGDRRTYQMDPRNTREALKEAELDVIEGADILMVKPAMAYLDVVAQVKQEFNLPVATYNVSGEYAMVKAAAERGWINEQQVVIEALTGMKRAGADMIVTYHAVEAAKWLGELA
jgi:porphobilinogen synthase